MAQTATLFAVQLQIADQDRQHYHNYSMKVALHPSEQIERLIARLLVWSLYADEKLLFGKGLSSRDDAEIWQHHDHGDIALWIEVGEPDAARVKKASRQSDRVIMLAYTRSQDTWWKKQAASIRMFKNVEVLSIPWETVCGLAAGVTRQIHWQVTISDGALYISHDDRVTEIPVTSLFAQ